MMSTVSASTTTFFFLPPKTLTLSLPTNLRLPRLLPSPPFLSNAPRCAPVASSASGTVREAEEKEEISAASAALSGWREFASRVSGEWDGYGAEFTSEGIPIELPENVVPEAFREWGVQVFDWQTQCPTLAETEKIMLTSKLIKLLPTVGCEADAATRHSIEERVVGVVDSKASAFAFDKEGNYVSLWHLKNTNKARILELEHCLVDPRDREIRIRIVQTICVDRTAIALQKIMVFAESWYGPFRNGEQLGGCAIRESSFASTASLEESKVLGAWQGTRSVADFQNDQQDVICELVNNEPYKVVKDKEGLVTLPKQLWCCLKEWKYGETYVEVGWLLDQGRAMTSTCTFLDGHFKSVAIGQEAAVLEM